MVQNYKRKREDVMDKAVSAIMDGEMTYREAGDLYQH